MDDATPLTTAEAEAAIRQVVAPAATGVVLAVSGGPDSMALLHLAAGSARRFPWPTAVATVDHGLRASSPEDNARVAKAAGQLGLACHILPWRGDKPDRRVQERARDARYTLLGDLCRRIGADHLLTAHTRDDQAETVLFRIGRGTGIKGLGAMRARTSRKGVVLARPFLTVAKARLLATCNALGVAVHHDPANADPRFARARLRGLDPSLAAAGLDAPRLAQLAGRAARADAALDHIAGLTWLACRKPTGTAGEELDFTCLAAQPEEIAIRVLGLALEACGSNAIRLERLERAALRLMACTRQGQPMRTTLGPILLDLTKDGALTLMQAPRRRRGDPAAGSTRSVTHTFSWQGETGLLHSQKREGDPPAALDDPPGAA